MWSAVDRSRPPLSAFFSVSSTSLYAEEKDLFRQANPLGFILFSRNCRNPDQIKKLVYELKESAGRDCPVLIDQEGGRVQRLKPPHWNAYPPAQQFGECYFCDREAGLLTLESSVKAMAGELAEIGVNVNCAPVLDVLSPYTHEIIGDRAFSARPETVSALGLEMCRVFLAAGVTPVVKHMPGHGRAAADSHLFLPRVAACRSELASDFQPFRHVAASGLAKKIWGMAAHVVYECIDDELPASISPQVVERVIRRDIGFGGFLITDDLAMKALDGFGGVDRRALMALEAGCDAVLHCSGDFREMEKLAQALPPLSASSLTRLDASCLDI